MATPDDAKVSSVVVRKGKMSAATRNEYRKAFVGFCNWCLRTRRLSFNPLAHVPLANEKADPRRKRRALNEVELMRLLTVAQLRPLADFGRKRGKVDPTAALARGEKPKRSNWKYLPLTLDGIEAAVMRARETLKNRPEFIAKQERLGRERALIYKTLVLTGLRKGEFVYHQVNDSPFGIVTRPLRDRIKVCGCDCLPS